MTGAQKSTKTHSMEWKISQGLVDYPGAVSTMEDRVAAIHDGRAEEMVWLLEHPPLYTAGTSAKADDLLDDERRAVARDFDHVFGSETFGRAKEGDHHFIYGLLTVNNVAIVDGVAKLFG